MKRMIFVILGLVFQFGLSDVCGAHEVYMPQAERMQPNGTRFIGEEWDSEFYFEYETMEGYRYVFDPSTAYYCYAILDHSGEYVSSGLRVGIDNPKEHGLQKALERTPARMAEIRRKMESRGYIVVEESRLAKCAVQTPPDSMTLAVVLVEFQDIKHRTSPSAYTRQNFEDMLFGTYTGTSPDGETVYGSVAQYYNEMSGSDFVLTKNAVNGGATGGILNGGGTVPTWLTLPNNKAYYTNCIADTFFTHAQSAANTAGLNVTTSTTRKIAYIYAGNYRRDGNGGLIPQADGIPGTKFQISERMDNNPAQYYRDGETPPTGTTTFTHIGTHAHELGHILGLYHPGPEYGSQKGKRAMKWCLMQGGSIGGPRICSCPWPINPFYRAELGWLTLQDILSVTMGKQILSGTSNAYRVMGKNDYQYILEHKNKQGFTQYIDYFPFSSAPGLFIWHRPPGSTLFTRPTLVVADNSRGGTQSDFFGDPFPGNTNNQNISDYTTINLRQSVGSPSYSGYPRIGLFNIANNTTYTSVGVYPNYWEGTLSSNTTWSGQVYVGGDVTVPSGVTLTISSGTTVKSATSDAQSGGTDATKSELIVEGTLDVNGTSSDKVTFTSSASTPQAGDWYGIVLEDGSSVDIDHATIAYAKYGIRSGEILYSNALAVDHSTLRNCLYDGLRLEYWSGTATLENTTIKDNGSKGIYASSGGTLSLDADSLINNGSYHTYLSSCALQATNCVFTGNDGMAEHGIRAYNVSGAVQDTSEFSDNYVHVYVQSNNGGMTLSDTNFDLGAYHVYNSSADTVEAEDNYWGTTNSATIAGRMYGPVDWNPYRQSPVSKPILISGWDPIPASFDLMQNFPNPFNPVTVIRYQIPRLSVKDQAKQARVVLEIYNLLGQRVRRFVERTAMPGHYTVTWDSRDEEGRALASGLYFCRMQVGDFVKTNKMLLLR